MTKTTKKDFELFMKECKIWEERLRLDGWSILYLHEEAGKALAETDITPDTRTVCVRLNTEWTDPINTEAIKETAKHEMIHVLLGRMSGNASYRYTSKIELDESEEELVYKLEKIIK